MSKRVLLLLIAAGLLLIAILTLWMLYSASQYVPAFYRNAMDAEPEELEAASDQMLQQVAALASAIKKEGKWEALFSADQINGWLAVDMVKNHPNATPPTFCNPRVEIDSKQITVAGLFEQDSYWSVLSLTIEPSVPKPNVLRLRIIRARAGLLPLPLSGILDQLSQTARDLQLHLEWRQAGGDPVAILSFPTEQENNDRRVHFETLRFGDGEIYVSGVTE